MIRKNSGFTLIELLIVVAIVGILAGIAYPSYTAFVTESNRSEGQRELLRIANLMEQYFLDNRTYTQDMGDLGLPDPFVTENGFYSIDSTDADGDGYTLTATAQGAQATGDATCLILTVDDTGRRDGTSGNVCWE